MRQIHLEVLDHLILGAQAQQGREILEELQIQDHLGDKLEVGEVVLVLQEEQALSKVKVVTVIYG